MSQYSHYHFRFSLAVAVFTAVSTSICSAMAEQPHWLLLSNGQVLQGVVSSTPDRTIVNLQNGAEIRLSSSQVSFVGQSLEELYLFQRARKVRVRAIEHLEIADWCFNHNLLTHAETHLTQAFELEPDHPGLDIRQRRLVLLRSQTLASNFKPAVQRELASEEIQVDVEKIVDSLPTSTIQDFVRHVQPILLKNCSTARCHDSSGNHGFALIKPTFSNTIPQRYSRRNLVSTISVIDESQPLQSPLVKMALTPHASTSLQPTVPLPDTETGQWKHLKHWLLQFTTATATPPNSGPLEFSQSAPNLLMQRKDLPRMPIPAAYKDSQEAIGAPVDPFDPSLFNQRR
ncbi:MAG: hypothetical protein ACJZ8O_07055 [Pirellulaceae bacterium]